MPRKVSESQKKEMIDCFFKGKTIQEISEKFNCTKNTVTRHLKNGVSEKTFRLISKKSNKNGYKLDFEKDLKSATNSNKQSPEDLINEKGQFEDSSFVEIVPLQFEIDNQPQKDLSSISISEIDFPKIVYMIVNNKIELETKLLGDYPSWQFLSQNELNRKTIEIFFDLKIAKKFCSKEQKVIKVPNTNVFKIVAPILVTRGISRIVSPDKLIAL